MVFFSPLAATVGIVEADVENGRVLFPVTVPENTGSEGTQHIQVQVSEDGGEWRDLTNFELVDGFETVVYDYEAPAGAARHYRARGVQVSADGTNTIGGEWSPVTSGVAAYDEWWLKCPATPALNMRLFVEGGVSFTPQLVRDLTYPMSREDPIRDYGVDKLDIITVQVFLPSRIEMKKLRDLVKSTDDLLLQDDLGEQWYCVVGESPTFERASSSARYTTSLKLHEVLGP